MPYQDAANIPEFDSQNLWSKRKIYNYRATVNTIFRNCNVSLTDAEYETTQNVLIIHEKSRLCFDLS